MARKSIPKATTRKPCANSVTDSNCVINSEALSAVTKPVLKVSVRRPPSVQIIHETPLPGDSGTSHAFTQTKGSIGMSGGLAGQQLNVGIPADLARKMRVYCAVENAKMPEAVARALALFLEKEGHLP